ncbi:hypothetical protein [Dyadobacter sp. LHD-138]|uniref:hypothetical protein n=1 Tax=Dyadobacter sp. LHD-138 TaxID=3071413 RepID=UPI0027DF5C56|nr:hypothetical protein [Dyadobacter sp. LHD-138]MDQ6479150.1 hypothetical protein [Dyadobacter sp. LHD-138]
MISSKPKAGGTEKLNDMQISMLRLFDQNMSEVETLEVRKILMDYFDNRLQNERNQVLKEKQYSNEDFDKMLSDDKFKIG